jgi:hypothetical protein
MDQEIPVTDQSDLIAEPSPEMQSQQAISITECETHTFRFLRTFKNTKKTKGAGKVGTEWRRVDTFFCHHCLRYVTIGRNDLATEAPDWYKDS